jgi:MFS family permease
MDAMPRLGVTLRLLGVLCPVLALSQFLRTALAVIAPELTRDLGLSPEVLGLLTGAFFIASAMMQIPVGVLLDRFGPRRAVPGLLVMTVIGALLFASAHSVVLLIAGQFLIGVGCAGVFMGGLVTISRWYPRDRFATIASVALGISNIGPVLSGTPFAAATEAIGWRGSYDAIALITAVLAALVYLAIRDAPPGHPFHNRGAESFVSALRGVGQVLRDPRIFGVLAIGFVVYSSTIAIRGLWAGPYFADIYHLGPLDRGNVLVIMSVALIAFIFAVGPLDRVADSRKRVIAGTALIFVAIMIFMALEPGLDLWLAVLLLCLALLGGAANVHILAHGRAFFSDHLVGRALTTVNCVIFVGVGVIQVATGFIVGAFPAAADGAAPEIAYRAVFAFLAFVVVLALGLYARTEDAPPSRDR